MWYGGQRYIKEKNEAATLPHIELSKHDFVELFIKEKNVGREKAEFQATMAAMLGSSVRIGDKMVSIVKEKKDVD